MSARVVATGAAIAAAVALAAAAGASANQLKGVIGTGGTPAAGIAGSGHVMVGTVGQPVVGASMSATQELCHGYWCRGGASLISVEGPAPGGPTVPTRFALGPPVPNPAAGSVGFVIAIPRAARASLEIYDLLGRRVDQTSLADLSPGYQTVRWRGAKGAGVYFARLVVDGAPLPTRRFVLLR